MSSPDALTPSKVAPRGRDPAIGVYYKFLFFSVALFAAPLAAYFFAKDRFLNGNPTYAGGVAALVANVVLLAYVVVAFLEDQGEVESTNKTQQQATTPKESKKDK